MSASVTIKKCKNCGFALDLSKAEDGRVKCPKCKQVNEIVNVQEETINPLSFSPAMAKEYIDAFKQQAEENPKDTNALYAMGLLYLSLNNYELAQRNFKQAVDQNPLEPDTYYYYALSLFEGENPRHIKKDVVDRIEQWLHTASKMQAKRKYLILLMVLRQSYASSGLQFKGESPVEIMDKIRKMPSESDDVKEIQEHVKISRDVDRQCYDWLEEIRTGKRESDESRQGRFNQSRYWYSGKIGRKNDMAFSNPHDPDSCILALADESKRQEFFDNLYEPTKPAWLDKPFWPIFSIIKIGIASLIVLIIWEMFISCNGKKSWDPTLDLKITAPDTVTVVQEYQELYGTTKKTKAQRKELLEKLRNDSITKAAQRAEKDSLFYATKVVYAYKSLDSLGKTKSHFGKPTEEEMQNVVELCGTEDSIYGYAFLLIEIWPLILGLLIIIGRFIATAHERSYINSENINRQNKYKEDYLMWERGRASIQDYIQFCQHYLSKNGNDPVLERTGDPVGKALRENHIDETNMAGKILFVNYFDDKDADGNESDEPSDMLDRIYYSIAIPQRDKLTILYNYWDTVSNEIESCDTTNIFYRDIRSVNKEGDAISIKIQGESEPVYIVLPNNGDPSVFSYQNEFNEMYSYSNTRTSDPQLFIDALNRLVADAK